MGQENKKLPATRLDRRIRMLKRQKIIKKENASPTNSIVNENLCLD